MNTDQTALFKLSYGMYAVGSFFDGRMNAQIANTLFQVSANPRFWPCALTKKISAMSL